MTVYDIQLGRMTQTPINASLMGSYTGAELRHFRDIGHSLASLLVAVFVGVAARYFHATRTEASP